MAGATIVERILVHFRVLRDPQPPYCRGEGLFDSDPLTAINIGRGRVLSLSIWRTRNTVDFGCVQGTSAYSEHSEENDK